MMYKKNKVNRLDSKELLSSIIPLGFLILLSPIVRECLNLLEVTLKVMFRVN